MLKALTVRIFEKDSSKSLKTFTGSVQEREKLFRCNICDTLFTKNRNLKRHSESVHEGKKSCECTICDATFSEKGALKRHVLIKAFSIFLLPVPCQHVQCYSHACCKWHLSFAGQNANFSKSFLIPVPMCDGRL